jgi:aminocarboxymuconate-semialdehyde decarboxylase
MKLDIHTHILPKQLPNLQEKYGCPGWINIRKSETEPDVANMYKDEKFFRKIEKNCWCLHERYKDMQKTNVQTQVLSTVPVMFNYWAKPEHTSDLARLLNDDIAGQIKDLTQTSTDLQQTTKSFYAFGTLPMQDSQLAIEEMTRCCKDLRFKGIQIGSHINDWNLDEKKLYPIWKVTRHQAKR